MKYITRNNITLLIAVCGLALSVYNLLSKLWSNRLNLRISSTGYRLTRSDLIPDYKHYLFGLIVENRSASPVSLSYISSLRDDGSYFRFTLTHRFMKEHFIPPRVDKPYQFFTTDFPVNLKSYESRLIFVTCETKDKPSILFGADNEVSFIIKTNKKDIKVVVKCSPDTDFLDQ